MYNWYSAKKCGLLVLVTPFLSGASLPKKNPGPALACDCLFVRSFFPTVKC